MNVNELKGLIDHGEGETVDFKIGVEALKSQNLAKAMVCFTNTKGGKIIVGVEDKTKEIVGVKDFRRLEEIVRHVSMNNCQPPVSFEIEQIEIEDKMVVIIHIPKSRKLHQANRIYYIRRGTGCRDASPDELTQILYDRGKFAYDRSYVPGASYEDLNEEKIKEYISIRRSSPRMMLNNRNPKEFLAGIGLIDRDTFQPTVAAILLFGKYPPRFLPQVCINAFKFKGKSRDEGEIHDRLPVEGTVEDMINQATEFIKRGMRTMGRVSGNYREDIYEYPERALREVITNAVAHRDYSSNQKIMLRVFNDRLEVENPGGLIGGLTMGGLITKPMAYPRNPFLMGVMTELKLTGEAGSGIGLIFRSMRENGSRDPIFEADELRFMVTLPSRLVSPSEEEDGTE
ncbi:MAG: RNA-binding domain-containing protein [bacterium]